MSASLTTSSSTSEPRARRGRLLAGAAVTMLATAVAAITWTIGMSVVPNAEDAAIARDQAYRKAWESSRGDAYQPAYEAAWVSASATGAAAGRREGSAAGAAAARRAVR